MYDVISMKATLYEALAKAESDVQNKFSKALKSIYANNKVPAATTFGRATISKHKLKTHTDLDNIIGSAGFYIILTDYPVVGNDCRLVANSNLRAIYRGECGTTRKRIQSHLFNTRYKKDYEKRKANYQSSEKGRGKDFYEPFWPACIKIKLGVNGIDIDLGEYKESDWLVIVHNMKGSSQEVRHQAEMAFDEVFGKPAACRDKA
jgi:hypothetical protein